MKRFTSLFLIFILLCSVSSFSSSAKNIDEADLAIVFTHDIHSHIDPFSLDGKSVGGMARIKSVIDTVNANYDNTIILDGGDFSMGTLFQTAYATEAIEYRMLGYLGYEATTFGNHEFDYGFDDVVDMISVAEAASDYLPPILCANINAAESGLSDNELTNLNIKEYEIYKKGDYKIAVLGLLGRDAAELSSASGLVFDDFIDVAKTTVEEIKNLYAPDVIICLSHSGTGESVKDEDIQLAKAVGDIDIIISGHTHTYLSEPIVVGNTIIGSCGEYGEYVGTILLDIDTEGNSLVSYKLTEINDTVPQNNETLDTIDGFRDSINEYLSAFGYDSGEQILAYSPYEFPEQNTMSDDLAEQPLGNLISDSYIYAIKSAEGNNYINVDIAVAPVGVIRASIDKGYVTVNQAYEISSLGIGSDGVSGYPLCSVYLYGSELWALAEIDASISGIMPYAQLYCSGLGYSLNTNRMFMNRVYDCWIIDANGNRVEIIKDKLYRVASGITSTEMLGTVKDKSFGLLELTPKDANGNPITDFKKYIVKDKNGAEVKEWKALADYLTSFPKGQNGISVIPAEYSGTLGRKNISHSLSIAQLFTNWNYISWTILFLTIVIIMIIAIIIVLIIKKTNKKKRNAFALEFASEEDSNA